MSLIQLNVYQEIRERLYHLVSYIHCSKFSVSIKIIRQWHCFILWKVFKRKLGCLHCHFTKRAELLVWTRFRRFFYATSGLKINSSWLVYSCCLSLNSPPWLCFLFYFMESIFLQMLWMHIIIFFQKCSGMFSGVLPLVKEIFSPFF